MNFLKELFVFSKHSLIVLKLFFVSYYRACKNTQLFQKRIVFFNKNEVLEQKKHNFINYK
jgi:hypothetical protein